MRIKQDDSLCHHYLSSHRLEDIYFGQGMDRVKVKKPEDSTEHGMMT